MSETEVNIPLLRKAVEWAEAEAAKPPELCEWVQGSWVVPTGPANDLWNKGWGYTGLYEKSEDCGTCFCIAGYTATVTVGPMEVWRIEGEAMTQLGLTSEQAEDLFYSDNTIEDVRRIAEDIAGERL